MIVCEGLHFRREGEDWRCVEHPTVRMMRGGGYMLDGNDRLFLTLDEVLEELQRHDMDDDGVCRRCGFDGADWWHLERQRPKRERRRAPRCS